MEIVEEKVVLADILFVATDRIHDKRYWDKKSLVVLYKVKALPKVWLQPRLNATLSYVYVLLTGVLTS